MMAYSLLALALWHFWRARNGAPGTGAARRAAVIAGLVGGQSAIGVVTLLLGVPIWAGLLHQAFAMLVLGMAVVHARRLTVS